MSQIITHWKCEHCGAEFNQYFSFGHPNKAFDFKWACGKCGETNTQRIEAMPDYYEACFAKVVRKEHED